MTTAQRVWDYVMRRKGWFLLAIMVVLIAGALIKIVSEQSGQTRRQAEEMTHSGRYENTLSLRIPDSVNDIAYQMEFDAEFQRVTVRVSDQPLTGEAYIRILDENGGLIAGDYTEMRETEIIPEPNETTIDVEDAEENVEEDEGMDDQNPQSQLQYYFSDAPKAYAVDLKPDYRIEIKSTAAKFYSELNQAEAMAFTPTAGHETYIVTQDGLAKQDWVTGREKREMYLLLRDYLWRQIENYQKHITDEILNNKNLDTANKNQVILAYYTLEAEDRERFREFVEHLRRGGSPELTYLGKESYEVGMEVDFASLVSGFDNEDGEIAPEQIETVSEVDFAKPGTYAVRYATQDSDGNVSQLEIEVKIIGEDPVPPAFPGSEIEVVGPGEIYDETIIVPGFTGGGANTVLPSWPVEDDDTVEVADGWNEIAETEIEKNDNASSSAEQNSNITTPTSKTAPEAELDATTERPLVQNVFWIILGVVAVAGLVRFIFDHYVR